MSRFMRAMKYLGLTHDEPAPYVKEPDPTHVSHSVHVGEAEKLVIKATWMDGSYPIYTIDVRTSDDKVGIKFFVSAKQYKELRDGMRLDETYHGGSYGTRPPVTTTHNERLMRRFTPPDEVWGPISLEDTE